MSSTDSGRAIQLIPLTSLLTDLQATLLMPVLRRSSLERLVDPAPPIAPDPIVEVLDIPHTRVHRAYDPASTPRIVRRSRRLPLVVHRAYSPAEVDRATNVTAAGFCAGLVLSSLIAWFALGG